MRQAFFTKPVYSMGQRVVNIADLSDGVFDFSNTAHRNLATSTDELCYAHFDIGSGQMTVAGLLIDNKLVSTYRVL